MSTAAMFKSVADLRTSIVSTGNLDPAWVKKMVHPVPAVPVVKDRGAWLVEQARGKTVLDIGCTGPISKGIRAVAKKYYGVDKVAAEDVVAVDIDHRPDQIPRYEDVEIVICSEVIEHLGNPGYFLLALREHYRGKTVVVTVPNVGAYMVREDCEIVNDEHVCWYSFTTLKTLLTRYGFEIQSSRWYNGQPHKAEGIIMVAKA